MKPRIVYLDVLRIVAIFAVVLLHVVITPPSSFLHDKPEWWLTVIYKSLFLWAAPIFLMISGALILKKDEQISTIYIKRIPKILLPFITWSAIYIYFDLLHSKHTLIQDIITATVYPIAYHLWFVYAIIGLYIASPILRAVIQCLSLRRLHYLLITTFIIGTVPPIIHRMLGQNIDNSYDPFILIGYFFLGYYLNTYSIGKRVKTVFYSLAALSIPITIFGTFYLSTLRGGYDDFILKPPSITRLLMSIAIFLFFKGLAYKEGNFISNISERINLTRVCFGIYLSHVMVLGILEGGKLGFSLTEKVIYPPVGVLLNTVVVLALCGGFFLLLELLKKYRLIRFLSQFLY